MQFPFIYSSKLSTLLRNNSVMGRKPSAFFCEWNAVIVSFFLHLTLHSQNGGEKLTMSNIITNLITSKINRIFRENKPITVIFSSNECSNNRLNRVTTTIYFLVEGFFCWSRCSSSPCLSRYFCVHISIFSYYQIETRVWKKGYTKHVNGNPFFANEMMFWNLPLITFALRYDSFNDGWSQVMRMRCNYNLWSEWKSAAEEREREERRMEMGRVRWIEYEWRRVEQEHDDEEEEEGIANRRRGRSRRRREIAN